MSRSGRGKSTVNPGWVAGGVGIGGGALLTQHPVLLVAVIVTLLAVTVFDTIFNAYIELEKLRQKKHRETTKNQTKKAQQAGRRLAIECRRPNNPSLDPSPPEQNVTSAVDGAPTPTPTSSSPWLDARTAHARDHYL